MSSGFSYRVDSEAREGWLGMAVDVLGELGVSKRGRDPQTSSSFPRSMAEDLRHVSMSKFWAFQKLVDTQSHQIPFELKTWQSKPGPFLEDSQIHFLLLTSLKATFPFADFVSGFSGFQAKPNQRKAKAKACRAAFGQILKNLADVPISMESMVNSNFSFIVLFEENRILDLLTSLRVVLELAGKSGATVLRTQ